MHTLYTTESANAILDEHRSGALRLKKPDVKLLNLFVKELGSIKNIAKILGITKNYAETRLERIYSYAREKGVSPANGLTKAIPDSLTMKNFSGYYSIDPETGEAKIKGYWIKSDRNSINLDDLVEYLKENIEPDPTRTKVVPNTITNQVMVYTLTDFHLGMMAWGEETLGVDWNLEKAEKLFVAYIDHIIHTTPNTERAVFANVGDFLHFDGLLAVTPAHKHILDTDTRYQLLVRTAIRCVKYAIEKLSEKHNHLTVVMAEGNHDEASSVWLREAFKVMYSENPNIEVVDSPNPYSTVQFGNTAFYFHHGHKSKVTEIAPKLACMFPKLHGDTEHRYVFMGHYHHHYEKEDNGYTVMQMRTLAPNDAHSAR